MRRGHGPSGKVEGPGDEGGQIQGGQVEGSEGLRFVVQRAGLEGESQGQQKTLRGDRYEDDDGRLAVEEPHGRWCPLGRVFELLERDAEVGCGPGGGQLRQRYRQLHVPLEGTQPQGRRGTQVASSFRQC